MKEEVELQQPVSYGLSGAYPLVPRLLFRADDPFRGLAFTCSALMHMQQDTSAELYVCFKRAYDEVLRHHHSFLIRSVVTVSPSLLLHLLDLPLLMHPVFDQKVAIRAVPYRHDFYQRIAQGGSTEKLDIELAKWLAGLDVIVKRISAFVDEGNYGKV